MHRFAWFKISPREFVESRREFASVDSRIFLVLSQLPKSLIPISHPSCITSSHYLSNSSIKLANVTCFTNYLVDCIPNKTTPICSYVHGQASQHTKYSLNSNMGNPKMKLNYPNFLKSNHEKNKFTRK